MAPLKLFLIDSFGFIFRAYHARARSGAPPMRTSRGFSTEAVYIFTNMLRRLTREHRPEYIAAVFESGAPVRRMEEFADYKANRAEMPPDLGEQIPMIRRVLDAMRIPVLEYPGFEADDVIGTIAKRAEAGGMEVVIVSSDKDMLQLVNEHVRMLDPAKDDLIYDGEKVMEFMGVPPRAVPDLLALKGDAIDNIPGAPGIGDKGARDLIARFGSVEEAMARASEVERKTYRESLVANAERIRMSKSLATLDCDIPIEFTAESVRSQDPDTEALRRVYKELEFHSLLRELGSAADTRVRDYAALDSAGALDAWLRAIPENAPVAVVIAQSGRGEFPMESAGLAWKVGEARCVPQPLIPQLEPLLEDPARPKIAFDVKTTLAALKAMGIAGAGFVHDVMLYGFLLDADPSGASLAEQAQRRLDRKLEPAIEAHADAALELWERLNPAIDERNLRKLYEDIELPLAGVLGRMEETGIRIDPVELRRLSVLMEQDIARLTAEIHAMAGKTFNISSPQQLARVLFEDMKLPAPVKYGKGRVMSTAADILEDLAAEHEIARKVLDYRGLCKLKGTYVDALPALIDPRDGRLHTSFNQAGAATGRLSSSNPNLQNIPIRTELGREIRAAFVPREGWKLIVADYSQIELRLLAHMSGCPVLLDAFRRGEDIHTRTAAEVMGIAPLMVTPDQRRAAKAVNFGIVYGISAFGLAAQLGISRGEAERYIQAYFERYNGVKKWIEATIAEVRKTGVTRTLFGRERPIPDMNSRNPNARGFAERTAVNSPLQGTAADLIKLAMVRIDAALKGSPAALLLQVHDELVLEAPAGDVPEVASLVKREMEGVEKLAVPLLVDVGVGDNWRDAK